MFCDFESLPDGTIVLEGLNNCVVGLSESFDEPNRLFYSKDKIINTLMLSDMTYDEAVEYYDYNILGGYFGDMFIKLIFYIIFYKEKL
jgi:hypothetical protein